MKFIVYQCEDETLICTKKSEPLFLSEWFEGTGRKIEEYDRSVIESSGVGLYSQIVVQ